MSTVALDALEDVLAPVGAGRLPKSAKVTLGAVFLLTVLVLPICRQILGSQPAFLPMVLSAVLLVDVVSAYLLVTRFRDTGDTRLLVMALAYVWSSIVLVGYSLSFPGLVSASGPLTSWPSATPWLYCAWHVGFPFLLAVAWGYPARFGTSVVPARRRRVARSLVGGCVAAAGGTVMFVALAGSHVLPTVIVGTDLRLFTAIAGPPSMVLAIGSSVFLTRRLGGRGGPERWAMVAAWVCVADLALVFYSLQRFSLGWYVGRGLTVLCSSIVFLAMLGEFTALQRRLLIERGRLQRQARTDDLTGLANRLALRELLQERLREAAPGALMLLDLDRFKVVNDSLGHEAGDAVIVETGRRLTELSPGDLVVRLGGDEFAVVLASGTGMVEAAIRAEEILAHVALPYELVVAGGCSRAYLGVSIGIAIVAGQGSPSEVLREADLALYKAKESGRGRVAMFDDELRLHAQNRLDNETTIRIALDENRFVPHLQPVLSLIDGRTEGYELLLRLPDAAGRETLPADLIEVAEESGLIVDIDARMLLTAARLIGDDPERRLGTLAVNMSARTLVHPGLTDTVAAALRIAGPDPSRLAVEITERVLLQDGDLAGELLAFLRATGIRVGLDDFGTGYSSLAYLRRFPLDFLKVDRSFVTALDQGTAPAALLQAVLSIAEALDLTVIVEGIETAVQQHTLINLGFSSAQGYLLGRPAPLHTWWPGHPEVTLQAAVGPEGGQPVLHPPDPRRSARDRRSGPPPTDVDAAVMSSSDRPTPAPETTAAGIGANRSERRQHRANELSPWADRMNGETGFVTGSTSSPSMRS